jgi:glyoxylase-like metal-dependent hydrolase (beta-lactamase superfamily II)
MRPKPRWKPSRSKGQPLRMAEISPDASLIGDDVAPDASLIGDDGLVATSHAGLKYPFGDFAPGAGEAFRVADGVRWVRLPMPGSLGHINSWILDDAGGYAIVDTGLQLRSCSDAWKALETADLAGETITRIFGTHMHPDHIGLAGWLVKRHGVELWMTRGEMLTARMLTSDNGGEIPAEVATAQRTAGWSDEDIAAQAEKGWGRFARMVYPLPIGYHRIMDGDMLDFGKHKWRVVVGSGHSPEHACLLNEKSGVLISGDQVLPRISSNVSINVTEPNADPLGEWLDSIDRLLTLPDDVLVCPAHGLPFKGLHIRLCALRDEHLKRLDDVAAFVAEQPRRIVDCFALLFNRPITGDHLDLATGEALAHLRRLERTGRTRFDNHDGVHWYGAA